MFQRGDELVIRADTTKIKEKPRTFCVEEPAPAKTGKAA